MIFTFVLHKLLYFRFTVCLMTVCFCLLFCNVINYVFHCPTVRISNRTVEDYRVKYAGKRALKCWWKSVNKEKKLSKRNSCISNTERFIFTSNIQKKHGSLIHTFSPYYYCHIGAQSYRSMSLRSIFIYPLDSVKQSMQCVRTLMIRSIQYDLRM